MPPTPPLPFERPIRQLEEKLAALEADPNPSGHLKDAIRALRREILDKTREVFDGLDAAQTVKVARHAERPQARDYVELIFDDFVELHGDRAFGDDPAILTGFAKLDGRRVLLVGQQKGRTLKERTACFYGCAHPEGYRKALEKMRLAEKFGLPVVCLIDTPGAYPGVGAEERGQSYAIALNLREMARLKTPIVCAVIGEGGSGGALGIGIGDHVAVMQFAYYSVISPEGCAGILFKGATPEKRRPGRQRAEVHRPAPAEVRRGGGGHRGAARRRPPRPPGRGGGAEGLALVGSSIAGRATGGRTARTPLRAVPQARRLPRRHRRGRRAGRRFAAVRRSRVRPDSGRPGRGRRAAANVR